MTLATLSRTTVAALAAAAWLLPSAALAAPTVQIEPDEIDLGTIDEGNLYERFVTITNAGDGVLVLEDIKTSCGCTAAAVDGVVELTSGESQEVRLTFNSKNMDGEIHKKVTIFTNDPKQPQSVVMLKGDVHRPIRWEPKYVSINRVGANDEWSQPVQLQSDPALGLEVKDAFVLGGKLRNKPSDLFEMELAGPTDTGERMVHEITLSLAPTAKPQKVSEQLVVVTNQPAPNDTLKYMIRGEIVGRIKYSPNFAVLSMVDPGEQTSRDITFTASEGTFEIVKAEVPDSPVQVEIFPQPNSRQAVVRLTYTGEEAGVNGVRQLVVETDDPEMSEISLPVRYQTRAQKEPPTTVGAAGPK
jgi:hypothetical protein